MSVYFFHCRLDKGGTPCPECVNCGKAEMHESFTHKQLMEICDKVLDEEETCHRCGPSCPYSFSNLSNSLAISHKPNEKQVDYPILILFYFMLGILGFLFLCIIGTMLVSFVN